MNLTEEQLKKLRSADSKDYKENVEIIIDLLNKKKLYSESVGSGRTALFGFYEVIYYIKNRDKYEKIARGQFMQININNNRTFVLNKFAKVNKGSYPVESKTEVTASTNPIVPNPHIK